MTIRMIVLGVLFPATVLASVVGILWYFAGAEVTVLLFSILVALGLIRRTSGLSYAQLQRRKAWRDSDG